LLLYEAACVEATFGIESKNGIRGSDDAHRLAGHKFTTTLAIRTRCAANAGRRSLAGSRSIELAG
jgi:hypothetical protein